MLKQVNSTEYGLTASIYTKDVATAQDIVKKVEAGCVWVNQVGRHFLNVPFGGYKESGGGREVRKLMGDRAIQTTWLPRGVSPYLQTPWLCLSHADPVTHYF